MSIQQSEYKIIRSKRKTISIEVTRDEEIIVRAPKWISLKDIRYFVDEKQHWISKALERTRKRREEEALRQDPPVLTDDELDELFRKAKQLIPERVAYYAGLIGVTYGRITIRNQRTRWGSCAERGNLNFNCLLMLAPPEVLDAIVVHELCHRKEMNHSKRFYEEVYKVYPEYDKWNKWLKEHGSSLQCRNPASS